MIRRVVMIKNVQEGLEKYKQVLREYVAWTNELARRYDASHGKGNWSPMANWGGTDFAELQSRNVQLEAMVEVLGLTGEEEAAIDKECGIKTSEELAAAA